MELAIEKGGNGYICISIIFIKEQEIMYRNEYLAAFCKRGLALS